MTVTDSYDQGLTAVAAALKEEKSVLVTTHVKPEGDALGSMIAVHRALGQLGIDSVMYMAETGPVVPEYGFLKALAEVSFGELPADAASRTVCAVDCGNADRVGNAELMAAAGRIINIDHHSDNSLFGAVNFVARASSTAEIIYFLLGRMGTDITPEIAEALLTGIVIDSGRFQYSSTTPTTLRVAADLMEKGVDHSAVYSHLYENVPLAKVALQGRMFDNLIIACDGRLAVGVLKPADFRETDAEKGLTEGLVESLRAIERVEMAALVHSHPSMTGYRVSLRSSTSDINVQAIARMKGGGGHPQAAGFTAAEGERPEDVVEFLVAEAEAAMEEAPLKQD